MKFKNKSSENTMSAPDIEEQEALDRGSRAKWVTGLCVILAVALLVGNLPSGVSNVTTVHTKLYSGAIQKETISTVLSGGGILTPQEGQTLSIPQSLEVQARYVSNGDRVSAGDPIAQVDKTAVISAIAELQKVLKELDGDLSAAAGKTNSSSIRSGSAGRVKKIYAQVGTSAADTMYDQGALMLLSLDGLLAAELEGTLPVGQSVTVTLSDGCQLLGTVESITENTSIVTLSDETAPVGDPVTVTGDTGEFLGQGTLYIHSMLRLTGAYGTVSAISVKENQKIYGGTTLISLKDTGHTPEYEKLLSRREELEEQMEMLVKLSKDGILYATDDGLVSGLDGSLPLEALAAAPRSQASPGWKELPGTRLEAAPGEAPPAPEGGSGSEGSTGSNTGGETGSTGGSGSGGEGGEEQPTEPTQPEGAEYTLGYVRSIEGGITYVPQGTMVVTEGSTLPALAAPGGSDMPLDPAGLTVKESTGSGWTDSDSSQITVGDSILIGNGLLVFQHNAAFGTGEPGGLPQGTPGGTPDMDSILAGMTGSMGGLSGVTGMTGGMGGTAAKAQTAYDSYDTETQDVASIIPEEEMTVDIQVDELDILSLQVGMAAKVSLDALPGQEFTGSVTKINAYGVNSGGNTKYTVTVTIPRQESMLSGMNASVKITTAQSQPLPTVPAEAIVFEGGKSWLYTAYDGKTDTLSGLTEIQTGISDGSLVELRSGLDENTTFYYRCADTIEYSFVG